MAEFLRDAALQYSQNVLPSVGGSIVVIALVGWFGYLAWTEDYGGIGKLLAGIAAGIVVVAAISLSAGWSEAQAYCEQVWREQGEGAFRGEKCAPISPCDDNVGSFFETSECGPPAPLLSLYLPGS